MEGSGTVVQHRACDWSLTGALWDRSERISKEGMTELRLEVLQERECGREVQAELMDTVHYPGGKKVGLGVDGKKLSGVGSQHPGTVAENPIGRPRTSAFLSGHWNPLWI